jgi:hypothetical protein
MMKDVQAALEGAIAEFEKWRQAEQERLRERERFEADWARIRTAVVLSALEEVAVRLREAGWECEFPGTGKNQPEVRFTVCRLGPNSGFSGGVYPYMTYQPERQKNTVLVYLTMKGSNLLVGNFALDKITDDFVQTEATKFFTRVVSEIASPQRKDAELV